MAMTATGGVTGCKHGLRINHMVERAELAGMLCEVILHLNLISCILGIKFKYRFNIRPVLKNVNILQFIIISIKNSNVTPVKNFWSVNFVFHSAVSRFLNLSI